MEKYHNTTESNGKQRLIVVLGMHRSGTSAITRGLQVLGVSLGDNLAPAFDYNAKGLWEDNDFHLFNVTLLNAINSDWDHIAMMSADDVKLLEAQGYIPKALELLQQKVTNSPIFGLKDPRTAKLIPFWKKVFESLEWDINYILAIRNPLSVVKSLSKRDDFDAEKSYLLWFSYVLDSFKTIQDKTALVLDYDILMQTPKQELQRVANTLNLTFNQNEFEVYESQFLDNKLRHSVYGVNELLQDCNCPVFVSDIYMTLLSIATDKITLNDANLHTKFNEWQQAFNDLAYVIKLIDKQSNRIANLIKSQTETNQILFYRDALITELKTLVATRDDQINEFYKNLNTCENYIIELQNNISQRDQQINEFYKNLKTCENYITELQNNISQRDQQINEFNKQLINYQITTTEFKQHITNIEQHRTNLEQHITNLEQYRTNLEQRISEHETEMTRLNQTLSDVYNSSSWKLSYPIRFFGKHLIQLKTLFKS